MPSVSEPVQMYLPGDTLPLEEIMRGDLSFKGSIPSHPGHNTHAFAAKFPPQLPHVFIEQLTEPGETVLDPMAGSGTAIIEAARTGRFGLGVDIDPLAVRLCEAKIASVDPQLAERLAEAIVRDARATLASRGKAYSGQVLDTFGAETRKFVEYWFLPDTIAELGALRDALIKLATQELRVFFDVLLSSIIVTKSGGVTLARDLAHSRPHKVSDKKIKSAVVAFREKALRSIPALNEIAGFPGQGRIVRGDSKNLPLSDESVHLIVTSPPYANAIDYVRAHKFSLVWLGSDIKHLAELRRTYIGAERRPEEEDRLKSEAGEATVREIKERDPARSAIVRRYFLEMTSALKEMYRVLRPGRAAVIVVGPSTIRNIVVNTALILAEVGEQIGFRLVGLKERELDRDRRLMPVSRESDQRGIEARMHREHVIALAKPA